MSIKIKHLLIFLLYLMLVCFVALIGHAQKKDNLEGFKQNNKGRNFEEKVDSIMKLMNIH